MVLPKQSPKLNLKLSLHSFKQLMQPGNILYDIVKKHENERYEKGFPSLRHTLSHISEGTLYTFSYRYCCYCRLYFFFFFVV